jgi:hypothetical protein
MSNELAIATVTAALNEHIRTTVEDEVDGAGVSMLRPDAVPAIEGPGVNIFLYQVSPNTAYRNADLPLRRNSNGALIERPQVALDLHYLLTFYGEDADLEPQRVLGSVVRVLHARPLLTRDIIQATVASTSFPYLAHSDLAEQIERVKFTPTFLNLEELTKLWSVFFDTPYRLSVAYIGNLVLIDTDDSPEQALPVRTRNIYVRPFRQPLIEEINPDPDPHGPIVHTSALVIEGKRLCGDVTLLRLGEAMYTPARADLSDTRIRLDLSTATPTTGAVRAGLQGTQVIHRLLMGTPPAEHDGVESNVFPALLRPVIRQSIPGNYDIQLSPSQTDPDGHVFRVVTIVLDPEVAARQRVVLLLNEFGNHTDPVAYSFLADVRTAATHTVTFTIPDNAVATGDYIVRVQVDGAQSVPERDLVSNEYIEPRLAFP